MRILHAFFFLLLCVGVTLGQTKVEVITKTVEDQFPLRPGQSLKVEGSAASISIQTWDRREVLVKLKLISKGLERSIAAEELAYQQYVIDLNNDEHVIRNYMLLPKGLEKLSTIQETVIELYVPRSLVLHLSNRFGTTVLKEVMGTVEIDNEYGELSLESLNASLELKSTFGDVRLTDFQGSLMGTLQHSNAEIEGFSGDAVLKTKLGDVQWSAFEKVKSLRLNAEQSNVSFSGTPARGFYWNLKTKFGFIQFPGRDPGTKLTVGQEELPTIEVTTDFGEITINE